jgi:DNA primase catalytic subunit
MSSKEFGLEFRYGFSSKNILNTFNGTFTKDMIPDESITTKLILNAKQLREIKNEIIESGILDYPNKTNIKPLSTITGEQMPFETYRFKIKIGDEEKELVWEDRYMVSLDEFTKIRELTTLIKKIIQESPEYRKLPEPRGGYD